MLVCAEDLGGDRVYHENNKEVKMRGAPQIGSLLPGPVRSSTANIQKLTYHRN